MKLARPPFFLFAITVLSVYGEAKAQDVVPHRSFNRLVTSNGHAAVSYNRATHRVDTFLEHPYRFAAPRENAENLCFAADESRDLAFDNYFGIRVGAAESRVGTWLGDVPVDRAGYVPGTNIFFADQRVGGERDVEVRTYGFMPTEIEAPVFVMVARVTNEGVSTASVSVYALFNYRLGLASGTREPVALDEEVSWDAARSTFYEYGPSQGTLAYTALSPIASQSASTGENSAFASLQRGDDLDHSNATTGPTEDVSPALQSAEASLAPGATMWFAVAVTWALDEDAGPKVDLLRSWVAGRTPEALVMAETNAWSEWAGEIPAYIATSEHDLYRQSLAVLRMSQVREVGAGFGQLLASLPPGLDNPDAQWNIAWVRDMAYATVALARSGHLSEARDALLFQLHAPPGRHVAIVGRSYRISVTRYFGNGAEESDCNADGPNIEFDGFGLFLWSAAEYVRAGGDLEALRADWPTIETEIADVLIYLTDASGTIRADSSIWETHWNGHERRYTYTSLAAARGLCDAAYLATRLGETSAASRFYDAGSTMRDAVVRTHSDSRGALGQSVEDLLAGHGYIDAAAIEALNFGLIDPDGRAARATFAAIHGNLRVASGYGFMRNDDGGAYDSQEWVFVDLRLLAAPIDSAFDDRGTLRDFVIGQAVQNDNLFAELHDARTGDYTGSIPMVGFGAGAYVLEATRDAFPVTPACDAYASEPAAPRPDAGVAPPETEDTGCSVSRVPESAPWRAFPLLLVFALLARRIRRRS
ncbi:MAG: hypothetical protein IPK60_10050 [Sandaracinaceae bacterium]|nr:hypothetical protein [Sandaracinaceae bacterium]